MKHFTFCFLLLAPCLLTAQIWTEDFDGGNTTNPAVFPANCAADDNDYIGLVCVNGGACDNPISDDFSFTGANGTFFGIRDMDSAPCGGNLAGETLSFSAIDVSSCGGPSILYVCFTAAESRNMGGDMGNEWGSTNMREDTWDGASFLFVTASIDGATATDVTAIQAMNNSDTRPGIDVNCDGKADDAGEPELTDAFTNYCFELPSFGASLDLTFTFGELNTGGEDLALDDISVHCTADPGSLPGTLLAACTPFEDNTCFWVEDFDGSNTTNPFTVDCGRADSRDYFAIVCEDNNCADDINAIFDYTNDDGSFFGARDIDDGDACGPTIFGSLVASGIDISGCSAQLYLCMDIAESNSDDENSNSGAFDSWDSDSEVSIYTTFDGTNEVLLTSLQSSDGGNSIPGFDTACDGGDAEGPLLVTNTFTTYCFAMLDGNTVDIAIEVANLNTGGEDIAIDNIRLCCTDVVGALPGTVVSSCNIARPLPVALSYFRGEMLPKGASDLIWETLNEVDNDYFELEYGTNGEQFSFLARIEGRGSSSETTQYRFEHPTPMGAMNYYRLKQVDFDGTYTYSNIVALQGDFNQQESLVFPNPANEVINFVGKEAVLTIYDAYGKVVEKIQAQAGSQRIDVRSLTPGAYLLEILSADNTREVKRFIKQH